MRGDYKSRMDGYAVARQNGWMSANDIRALENMNPIPAEEGGDEYLINGNMIAIRRAASAGAPNADTSGAAKQDAAPAAPEKPAKNRTKRRDSP